MLDKSIIELQEREIAPMLLVHVIGRTHAVVAFAELQAHLGLQLHSHPRLGSVKFGEQKPLPTDTPRQPSVGEKPFRNPTVQTQGIIPHFFNIHILTSFFPSLSNHKNTVFHHHIRIFLLHPAPIPIARADRTAHCTTTSIARPPTLRHSAAYKTSRCLTRSSPLEKDTKTKSRHPNHLQTPKQTHNLEVPGSNPGWSTLKHNELHNCVTPFFLSA